MNKTPSPLRKKKKNKQTVSIPNIQGLRSEQLFMHKLQPLSKDEEFEQRQKQAYKIYLDIHFRIQLL